MGRIFWREALRLGLASVVIGSTAFGSTALAQVPPDSQLRPDNTLGVDNSIVNSSPDGIDTISGGATRGSNLFHSFEQFSIPNGRAALFDNGANIQNILTRVTGGSRSEIDGILAARGTANLFLLNPNGILFGQNASLNIGGSFIATTANSINFADGTQFSATPGTGTPLLTVSVPLGLQFGVNPGNMINRANGVGLQVDAGRTLALIGGNVSLEGGDLTAAGGRVELGAVAAPGVVGINPDLSGFRFSFPTDLTLSDISLTNAANVRTVASNGGSMSVNARNLSISDRSSLVTGIFQGTVDSQAGNIEINARDTVTVDGTSSSTSSSGIQNSTFGLGNAGNISIATGSLNIIGNAQIGSITNGQGNAGRVDIQARDRVSINGASGGLLSAVAPSGTGNGADISVRAGSLSLSNGGLIATSTLGRGNAGNIQIEIAGDISVSGGSVLQAASYSQGNAGNVTITAGDRISFDGGAVASILALPSDLPNNSTLGEIPQVQSDRVGGNIRINGRSLSLINGTQIATSVRQKGNAGNIEVNTTEGISASGGSILQAISAGGGSAGNIAITAGDRVSFDGVGSNGLPSSVLSVLDQTSELESGRRGGDIKLKARSLSLTNGAQFTTSTSGQGNAGNVEIDVSDAVNFVGVSEVNPNFRSGIFSTVEATGKGRGGDVNLSAGSLSIIDGAQVNANSGGEGDAGNIAINVKNDTNLDGTGPLFGGGIFSNLEGGVGKGGNVSVTTGSLSLKNGANISASTFSQGDAGSVTLDVRDLLSIDGTSNRGFSSGVFSAVQQQAVGNGGNVNVAAGSISLTNGGIISASSLGQGNAGNVTIDARDAIVLDGVGTNNLPSSVFSSVSGTSELSGDRQGGDIRIRGRSLSLTNGAQLNTSNAVRGSAGNIDVDVRSLNLDRGNIFAITTSGDGGNIRLRASKELRLRNNSQISTTAGTNQQPGDGGNISIDTPLVIANSDGNNDITANAFSGSGGRVDITADTIVGFTPLSRQELQALLGTDDPTQLDPSRLPSNDITAISQTNPSLSGTVTFNAADIDPSRDIVELPTGLVDASTLVAAGCPSGVENRFAVTGRGGLPPSPGDKLSPDALLTDWASLQTPETQNRAAVEPTISKADRTTTPVEPIQEATSWQFDRDGKVILTTAPLATTRRYNPPTSCQGS
ncbi:filamentous hemagglutinin N-terminal domain-containing protein [Chroococcidiopsis thermalis]|uniref:Filamentous hemagglutinin family outer membrane protein n=1 Tax=Chroococcidiopsis thermalis (strain PCC 7203) TaxID=251229 RepID=K9TTY6_CHRTP|nr:filamentous hemagglutinin N-terminal domain-containing protein [Chroococcidiopsis thermalis]AFY86030.1 filamentous hemagglutinin family outer membrane protein [Chroococcidiopsis thermalis PCC 7203]